MEVDENGVSLAEIEAETEQERSALAVLELKLQRDVHKFETYLQDTKDFENKTRANLRQRAETLKHQLTKSCIHLLQQQNSCPHHGR